MPLPADLASVAWLAQYRWIRVVEPTWWTPPSDTTSTAMWYGKDVLVRYSNTA